MKKAIIISAVLAIIGTASIGTAFLTTDQRGGSVQIFSPNGKVTETTSAKSIVRDLRGYVVAVQYQYSTGTGCKMRNMSTATKAGVLIPLPAGSYNGIGVNAASPFLNLTGCKGGILMKQQSGS